MLRPPAGDADLQALREALDGRWSVQLEALYRENDGEEGEDDSDEMILWVPEGGAYFFMPLSGIDGVLEEWEAVNHVIAVHRENEEDIADLDADAVLVPFGKDFAGNYLCVVLPPGGAGEGPVFQANHDDGEYGVVARDLASYFAMLPRARQRGAGERY